MSESATTVTNNDDGGGLGLTLPDEARDQRERWLWAAFLVLLTLVSFSPAIQGGFVWDDDRHAQNKVLQRGVDGLADVWVTPSTPPKDGLPGRYTTPQYYPMTFTSYWVEHQLWGDNPMGYHAVNILLHAGSALMLWEILRRLGVPGAWVAAALFAIHPIQTESVAWVTERKNVLAGAFFFGSLLSYLKFLGIDPSGTDPRRPEGTAGTDAKPDWQWYGIALGLFACALLSKTIACSLPVVLGIIIWWKRGRVTVRDVVLLAPFLVLGLIMASVTAYMEVYVVRAVGKDWDFNFVERLTIAGRAIWFYVYKLFVPFNYKFVYDRWTPTAADAMGWLGLLAAIAVVALLVLFRNKVGRGVVAAVLIYLVTLVPAMGFFNVYPMRYSFVADHFQYLSGVALLVLASAGVATWLRKLGNPQTLRTAGLVVSCAVLLVLGFVTFAQAQIYRSKETLWRDTIAKNPKAWVAYSNLGATLLEQAEQDYRDLNFVEGEPRAKEAIQSFESALALRDNLDDAYNNWGRALLLLGKPGDALEKFDQALALKPDSVGVYNNMGVALAKLGRTDQAIARYEKALDLNPKNPGARYNLSNLLLDQAAALSRKAGAGKTPDEKKLQAEAKALNAKARDQLSMVVQANPEYAEAWHKLGVSLTREGNYKEAFPAVKNAVDLKPELAEAHIDLAALYARANLLNEAGLEYAKAAQLQPENPDLQVRLGVLALMVGKPAGAKAFFEMALKLDPKNAAAIKNLEALRQAATRPATTRSTTRTAATGTAAVTSAPVPATAPANDVPAAPAASSAAKPATVPAQ
jgi:tetratricopeptide (TPR) repeat protein